MVVVLQAFAAIWFFGTLGTLSYEVLIALRRHRECEIAKNSHGPNRPSACSGAALGREAWATTSGCLLGAARVVR
jgi:hypothetical protein